MPTIAQLANIELTVQAPDYDRLMPAATVGT
jgi:hypothetical protein